MKKAVLIILVLSFSMSISQGQNFTKHGIASFNQESTLEEGDQAWYFTGTDQYDNQIRLSEKLTDGPVVLVFYRGYWCPHCSRYLSNYQDSLNLLKTYGADLIAVSPEPHDDVQKTTKKTDAEFSVISDVSGKIMKAYGVDFEVKSSYNGMIRLSKGVDLRDYDKNTEEAELPIPATYIINTEGKIIYRHFDPDYTSRASVKRMIEVLQDKRGRD